MSLVKPNILFGNIGPIRNMRPLTLAALGLIALVAYGVFAQFLINSRPLEEIRITTLKRPTPMVIQILLRRCNKHYERNTFIYNKCVNEALGI